MEKVAASPEFWETRRENAVGFARDILSRSYQEKDSNGEALPGIFREV
jgi:hypothetical protein